VIVKCGHDVQQKPSHRIGLSVSMFCVTAMKRTSREAVRRGSPETLVRLSREVAPSGIVFWIVGVKECVKLSLWVAKT
jgi:hypothetical protein